MKGLKLSNPFTGLGQKIETSSLFKGALPEGERFLENQLPLSKVLKDALLGLFPTVRKDKLVDFCHLVECP